MDLMKIFNKAVTASYRVSQPEQNTLMWQSGAFVSDPSVRNLLSSGAGQVIIPIINLPSADVEPNYGNSIKNDIAVPRQIGASRQTANVAFLNEGFVESSLQAFLGGVEPNKLVASWLDSFWAKQAQNRAIATMAGVYNAVRGDHTQDFIITGSKMDINAVIDAEASLSEKLRNGGIVVMHPKKKAELLKQDALKASKPTQDAKDIDTVNGRFIVESTHATQVGDKYITYFIGLGAFVADSQATPSDMEVERTGGSGNGAGHTTLWTRRHMLIHPQGFDFAPSELTGGTKNEAISASWGDLQNGENWELITKASDTSIRFLITD